MNLHLIIEVLLVHYVECRIHLIWTIETLQHDTWIGMYIQFWVECLTGCVDGGREYYNGDTWPSPRDPCQVCQCSEGIVTCKTNKSCMYRCTHGVIPQGKCCSDCRGKHENRIFSNCIYEFKVMLKKNFLWGQNFVSLIWNDYLEK